MPSFCGFNSILVTICNNIKIFVPFWGISLYFTADLIPEVHKLFHVANCRCTEWVLMIHGNMFISGWPCGGWFKCMRINKILCLIKCWLRNLNLSVELILSAIKLMLYKKGNSRIINLPGNFRDWISTDNIFLYLLKFFFSNLWVNFKLFHLINWTVNDMSVTKSAFSLSNPTDLSTTHSNNVAISWDVHLVIYLVKTQFIYPLSKYLPISL